MPAQSAKVREMVEAALRENPETPSSELFERAKKLDRSVSSMSVRQFHASYPLQVRRRLAAERPRRSRSPRRVQRRPVSDQRAILRAALLDFGRAIAAAESKAELVDALIGADTYVDRITRELGNKEGRRQARGAKSSQVSA